VFYFANLGAECHFLKIRCIMEQDPMMNSAIGFDLGISKDFGIMTHRWEILWVDDIERREGFSQWLIPSSI
jgi:hypothetical protein